MERDPYYNLDLLSNSRLGIVKSIVNGSPIFKVKKETLEFGRQLHEAVFEPLKYIASLNEALRNGDIYNENAEYYIKFRHKIDTMRKASLSNASLKLMIDNPIANKEFNHFFREDKYGIECKIKIDICAGVKLGDLKSTACKTHSEFVESIEKYDYDRQGAFYLDGYKAEEFTLFGVSKTYPHPTFTVPLKLDHPLIIQGRKKYEELMDSYVQIKDKINFQELMSVS